MFYTHNYAAMNLMSSQNCYGISWYKMHVVKTMVGGFRYTKMAWNKMVHISFWLMLMMIIHWEEAYILHRKTKKLWYWLVGRLE